MRTFEKQNGYWQGWNDFLGITKEVDVKNYLINLIGDIMDDFMYNERIEELANILVSDKTDSYLIHSTDAYRSFNPENISWMQIRIYYVDKYFIVISLNWDNASQCHYVGKNINYAADSVYHSVQVSQELLSAMLSFQPLPQLDLEVEDASVVNSSNYYELFGYNVAEFTLSDRENLRRILAEFRKSKRRIK
jgi:hypothetical protein